jgi:hypothetical protein
MSKIEDIVKHFCELDKKEKTELLYRMIFHTTISLRTKYEDEDFGERAKGLNEFSHIVSNYLLKIDSDKNYSDSQFIKYLYNALEIHSKNTDPFFKIIYSAFRDTKKY